MKVKSTAGHVSTLWGSAGKREATTRCTALTSPTYAGGAGPIKQAGSQLELSRDGKKEVAVSC